jgi:hypothetical protein
MRIERIARSTLSVTVLVISVETDARNIAAGSAADDRRRMRALELVELLRRRVSRGARNLDG